MKKDNLAFRAMMTVAVLANVAWALGRVREWCLRSDVAPSLKALWEAPGGDCKVLYYGAWLFVGLQIQKVLWEIWTWELQEFKGFEVADGTHIEKKDSAGYAKLAVLILVGCVGGASAGVTIIAKNYTSRNWQLALVPYNNGVSFATRYWMLTTNADVHIENCEWGTFSITQSNRYNDGSTVTNLVATYNMTNVDGYLECIVRQAGARGYSIGVNTVPDANCEAKFNERMGYFPAFTYSFLSFGAMFATMALVRVFTRVLRPSHEIGDGV